LRCPHHPTLAPSGERTTDSAGIINHKTLNLINFFTFPKMVEKIRVRGGKNFWQRVEELFD
jgi:hypothetical protein